MEHGDEISEYERLRLKKIEENRKCLLELGLISNKPPTQTHTKDQNVNSTPKSAKKRRQPTASPAPVRRMVTRRSAQLGDQYQHECIEDDEDPDFEAPRSKKKEYRDNFYGPVAGIKVGDCWEYRLECSTAGIHRPTVAGIHGGPDGAYSIALSGGYEDDVDYGDHFTYTGAGGRDLKGTKTNPKNLRTAPQSKNQTPDGPNAALIASVRTRNPVRVIRGYKLNSLYAPESGYRYDGLYTVDEYWTETGLSGFLVYKFKLSRMKGQDLPIWDQETNQENNKQNVNRQEAQKKLNVSPEGKNHHFSAKTPQNVSTANAQMVDKDQNDLGLNGPLSNSLQKIPSAHLTEDKNFPTGVSIQSQNGKLSKAPISPLKEHLNVKAPPKIGKDSLRRYFSPVSCKKSTEDSTMHDNIASSSIKHPEDTLILSDMPCKALKKEAPSLDLNGSEVMKCEMVEEVSPQRRTPPAAGNIASPERNASAANSRSLSSNLYSDESESNSSRNEKKDAQKINRESRASSHIKSLHKNVIRPVADRAESSPTESAEKISFEVVSSRNVSSNPSIESSSPPKTSHHKVNGRIVNETKFSPTKNGKEGASKDKLPTSISLNSPSKVTSPTKRSTQKVSSPSLKATKPGSNNGCRKASDNAIKEEISSGSSAVSEMSSFNDKFTFKRDLFNSGSNSVPSPSKNAKSTPKKESKNDSPSKVDDAKRRPRITRKSRSIATSPSKSASKDLDDSFSMLKSPPSSERKKSKTSNTLDRYLVKKFASNDISRSIRTSFPKVSPMKSNCDSDDESSPAFIGFNEITINNARNRLKLLTDFLPSIVKKQACRNKLTKFKKKKRTEVILKCSSSKREFITSIDKIRDLSVKISNMSNFDPNAGFIPECFVRLDSSEVLTPEKDEELRERDVTTDTSSSDHEISYDHSTSDSNIFKKKLSPQKLLDLICSDDESEDEPFLGFSSVSKRSIVRNAFLIQKYAKSMDEN
ncbi:unnamed protein product [Bemisia tabaci]|uniref:YDG domain-containing protein n=1 Tax=Bemisia tabaci TaxID=7038 RepID=A0A9P0F2K9_BEMTA|nr:unnamed protein product [Bemisia tabaci]CAH0385638.1 unnamed protein product [Bemisia tabaci]